MQLREEKDSEIQTLRSRIQELEACQPDIIMPTHSDDEFGGGLSGSYTPNFNKSFMCHFGPNPLIETNETACQT